VQGITFLGDRKLAMLDYPEPTPGPGEVVLEMKASGICGTDLSFYRSSPEARAHKHVAGHEPCGVVAELGPSVDGTKIKVGDRVMVHHYSGCGWCEHCRSGWAQLCQSAPVKVYGGNADGGHARYLKVPAATLVPLPDELSFQAGAAISCGTGTAYAALRRMHLAGNDTIAIFGQGPVGLSATQFASAMGARVIALDISPERLRRAGEFGADALVNPAETDPIAEIKRLTGGRGADLALDTSGAKQGANGAVRSTKIWGSVVLIAGPGPLELNITHDLTHRQQTIYGVWTFSIAGQMECARFVAERGIDVDRVFTHTWHLDQAEEAYRLTDAQGAGKGVFLL
jgi:threonine dehydrogenase-like Zn-dependent dehydrogenase